MTALAVPTNSRPVGSRRAPSEASSTALSEFFSQLYGYREYLRQSVLRDLRTKYKRSFFGYLWTMAHPLAMMAVLAVVFSNIMRLPDYAVFLFCGLLPWNYFNSTAMMSLHTIRANARLFGQIPVPKFIFVASLVCSNLANLLFAIVPLLIVMVVSGRPLHFTVLATPFVLLPLIGIVLAVSLVLAACNVFFDDTLHLAEVGMQALYFLSPVLYRYDMLPPKLAAYLAFNPLAYPIEMFRGLYYDGVLPSIYSYIQFCSISLLCLMLSLWFFNRVQEKFLYFV